MAKVVKEVSDTPETEVVVEDRGHDHAPARSSGLTTAIVVGIIILLLLLFGGRLLGGGGGSTPAPTAPATPTQ